MFSGHHDGIRGRAGGNCAYIAQSYGASIHEIEIAEMHTSSSGCRRPSANAQVDPGDEEQDAAGPAEEHGAVSSGVSSVFIQLRRSSPASRATCFGVEVQHQPENQHDQPEQRAEHDELAHDRTLPPSQTVIVATIIGDRSRPLS